MSSTLEVVRAKHCRPICSKNMDKAYSKTDEECLLLAYYFGRIKVLNCVALQRITGDLIAAFKSPPYNRSTKYLEPEEGCCLCREKEDLFKELLKQYYESTPNNEKTKDLDQAWMEVSQLWSRIIENQEDVFGGQPIFNVGLACHKLIFEHGLKVVGDDEYNRDGLDVKWDALITAIKDKLEECSVVISQINGKTEIPSHPGVYVAKGTMRNVYMFLATKKAARTHAKFMQGCRSVGISIRASRDPISVIAKYTMCTNCMRMGNKHQLIEVALLLKTGVSYLDSKITLDQFPDVEPMFGEDKKTKEKEKKLEKKGNDVDNNEWVSTEEMLLLSNKNDKESIRVRRSDRAHMVKKKNDSFLYYSNGVLTQQTGAMKLMPFKRRRASLPVLPITQKSAASTSNEPVKFLVPITNVKTEPRDSNKKENVDVVVVTAEKESSHRIQTNVTTPISTSLAPPSDNISQTKGCFPSLPLAPPSVNNPPQRLTKDTLISVPLSAAPSSGGSKKENATPVMVTLSRPSIKMEQKSVVAHPPAVMRPPPSQRKQQSTANTSVSLDGIVPSKLLPISPSSLSQLIKDPRSQKVIFFPANSFNKGINLKETNVIPGSLKMSAVPTPMVARARSISLDSPQAQKLLFQSIKPKIGVVSVPRAPAKMPPPAANVVTQPASKIPPPPATAPVPAAKMPFLVQIVNGKIQQQQKKSPPTVTQIAKPKLASAAILKRISVSRNQVKFMQSVSLKNQTGILKAFQEAGKLVSAKEIRKTTSLPKKRDSDITPMSKTLILGGNMKQGSIMRIGSVATKNISGVQPKREFQLGRSFTFKTKLSASVNHLTVTTTSPPVTTKSSNTTPRKVFFTNFRPPSESQSQNTPVSAALKKSTPFYVFSPTKTQSKKKHVRPPSKSMPTVVAEHIFSLMPTPDKVWYDKLNTKNKRRSEKSSALIPVPYETNFLCIHDTIERHGWKAYWYRKCRCSKIREKAAETDSEYDEPNPADVAKWLPRKITETMRKTLQKYIDEEDHVTIVAPNAQTSPPKEKMTPIVRVLLQNCDPDNILERKTQKISFDAEQQKDLSENMKELEDDQAEDVDIETIENVDIESVESEDVADSFSCRKRKSNDSSPETSKKPSSLTLKAKYRKDKNGNWTAINDDEKCENIPETSSDTPVSSQSEVVEDSVMLNIQPEQNSTTANNSSVAMEDRIGTTEDHGLRRCARATMIRRKALVQRAFDAETRFKTKRDRAEAIASESFLFGSMDESLANLNFHVVSAHPMCFREEPEAYIKIAASQKKRLESGRAVCINHGLKKIKSHHRRATEDSVMSLLKSPACPTLQAKVKRIQSRRSSADNKLKHNSKGHLVDKLESIWGNTNDVSVKTDNSAQPESRNSEIATTSDNWMKKVVNQITPDVSFNNLQLLRGLKVKDAVTNIISQKSAEFAASALLPSINDSELDPIVVLPQPICKVSPAKEVPTHTPVSVPDVKPAPLATSPSTPVCIPTWLQQIQNPVEKPKSAKIVSPAANKKSHTVSGSQKTSDILNQRLSLEEDKVASANEILREIFKEDDDLAASGSQKMNGISNRKLSLEEDKVASANEILREIFKEDDDLATFRSQKMNGISNRKLSLEEDKFASANEILREIFKEDDDLAASGDEKMDNLATRKSSAEEAEATSANEILREIFKEDEDLAASGGEKMNNLATRKPSSEDDEAASANEILREIFKEDQDLAASGGEKMNNLTTGKSSSEVDEAASASEILREIFKDDEDAASSETENVLESKTLENGDIVPPASNFDVQTDEKASSVENGISFSTGPQNNIDSTTKIIPPSTSQDPLCQVREQDIDGVAEKNTFSQLCAERIDPSSSKSVTCSTKKEKLDTPSPKKVPIDHQNGDASSPEKLLLPQLKTESENGGSSIVCSPMDEQKSSLFPWYEEETQELASDQIIEDAANYEVFNGDGPSENHSSNFQTDEIGLGDFEEATAKTEDFESENGAKFIKEESLSELSVVEYDKKHTNFIPSFFAIYRDLGKMLKMSKRGSLAHLSLSKSEKDSNPFKLHLRKKMKPNRNLSALLSHNCDLKRVIGRIKKDKKDAPKYLGLLKTSKKGEKTKKPKPRRSKKRPLLNMLNSIWSESTSESVRESAKKMPNVAKTLPKSRESTPETTRGSLLSKPKITPAKMTDILPMDVKTCQSAEEATTSSEVSEVQLIENFDPSPASSTVTSPRQPRKRPREDAHSLDGMYWSNLLDYDDKEPRDGLNLRRRRILGEELPVSNEIKGNKRKRCGNGYSMSNFDRAKDLLDADWSSLRKYHAEIMNDESDDEDTDVQDPLQTLLSTTLNVERVRSWMWDSTSPRPMELHAPKQDVRQTRTKNTKHNSENTNLVSERTFTPISVKTSEIESGDQEQNISYGEGNNVKASVFGRFSPSLERAYVPLMRCPVPDELSELRTPDYGPNMVLLRRVPKKFEGSGGDFRPKGLSNWPKGELRGKIDFASLFRKVQKDNMRWHARNKISAAVPTAENENATDVQERPQSPQPAVTVVAEENTDVPRPITPTIPNDVIDDEISPHRKVRSCRLKSDKSDDSTEAKSEAVEKVTEVELAKKRPGKKRDPAKHEKGKNLQALRKTVFKELKRKGKFSSPKATPETSSRAVSGFDRRRPLLQSRCSTKGSFISRLLECETECLLSNDVIKS